MNCFDYFFERTASLEKDLIPGNRDPASYQSIYHRSLKLAAYLNEKNGKGQNILLVSQNNLCFIIAYLAILKSGNTCIPLNPETEQSNLDFIIDTTKATSGFFSDFALSKLKVTIDKVAESELNGLIENLSTPDDAIKDFDGNQPAEIIF